jgi:hypothetical protein
MNLPLRKKSRRHFYRWKRYIVIWDIIEKVNNGLAFKMGGDLVFSNYLQRGEN